MSDVTTEIVKAQVPTETADALRELAESNERTLSAELRLAIRSHLEAAAPSTTEAVA